jgi:hypothetical protein
MWIKTTLYQAIVDVERNHTDACPQAAREIPVLSGLLPAAQLPTDLPSAALEDLLYLAVLAPAAPGSLAGVPPLVTACHRSPAAVKLLSDSSVKSLLQHAVSLGDVRALCDIHEIFEAGQRGVLLENLLQTLLVEAGWGVDAVGSFVKRLWPVSYQPDPITFKNVLYQAVELEQYAVVMCLIKRLPDLMAAQLDAECLAKLLEAKIREDEQGDIIELCKLPAAQQIQQDVLQQLMGDAQELWGTKWKAWVDHSSTKRSSSSSTEGGVGEVSLGNYNSHDCSIDGCLNTSNSNSSCSGVDNGGGGSSSSLIISSSSSNDGHSCRRKAFEYQGEGHNSRDNDSRSGSEARKNGGRVVTCNEPSRSSSGGRCGEGPSHGADEDSQSKEKLTTISLKDLCAFADNVQNAKHAKEMVDTQIRLDRIVDEEPFGGQVFRTYRPPHFRDCTDRSRRSMRMCQCCIA